MKIAALPMIVSEPVAYSIIISAPLFLTVVNMFVYKMKFAVSDLFDALSLTYISLGVLSLALWSVMMDADVPPIIYTVFIVIDFFLISFLVTGKLLLGLWIGENTPEYYSRSMYWPFFITWAWLVFITVPLYWTDDASYHEAMHVMVIGIGCARLFIHIIALMTKATEDESLNK